MADTKIEWTDRTWNCVVGCSVVSPGCTNCYAMKMAARLEAMAGDGLDDNGYAVRGTGPLDHYRGLTKRTKAGPVWTGKLALAPEATLTAPLRRRKPTRYFVNSMSDLFHESVDFNWILQVFGVMALTPRHTYQVLTKRAARMRELLSAGEMGGIIATAARVNATRLGVPLPEIAWPLPNVWLGVSCERQAEADARVPDLLETPAAVRFVSAEPLLGPVNFTRVAPHEAGHINALAGYLRLGNVPGGAGQRRLDWLIVGGESGPRARPMHPDWTRSIRDQCTAASVAFFFKQWGEWAPYGDVHQSGHSGSVIAASDGRLLRCGSDVPLDYAPANVGGGEMIYRVGKARAGRLLDGRAWDEYPNTTQKEKEPA